MRRAMVSTLALLLTAAAPVPRPAAHYRAVPFVGCPSDGQQGPQPAPTKPARPLPVWTPDKAGLAFYEGTDLAVLAPAGWSCLELSGSNGGTLLVTPSKRWERIDGPAVQLSLSSGETSGRFEVARVAARIFPVAKGFVRDVEREGLDKPFDHRLFPTDRIVSRDATHVRYVTPAGKQGLGTMSRLVPSKRPIEGMEILHLDAMDLTALAVRLPADQAKLAGAILDGVR